jgi:redox-sensitive bicupin YhaK (pirin superfamily)
VVNTWDLKNAELKPRLPEILSSSDAARVIALDLAAGETLSEHEVHERAWVIVIEGAIEVSTAAGECTNGGAGLLIEFESTESRREETCC